jgi:hypothetical protein
MRRYVQSHTLDTPINDAIRAGRGNGLGGHPKPAMHGHLKTGHKEAERSGR